MPSSNPSITSMPSLPKGVIKADIFSESIPFPTEIECKICPDGQCYQSPDGIYPNQENESSITCAAVQSYVKIGETSDEDCEKLQEDADNGVCGGCGLDGCDN